MNNLEFHKNALVIDAHNDLIVEHIRRDNLSIAGKNSNRSVRHDGTIKFLRGLLPETQRNSGVQLDLPKAREGGIDVIFCAIDVTPAWKNHLATALDAFGFLKMEVDDNADSAVVVKSTAQILEAKKEGKIAIVLAIENSEAIERSLNILQMLHEIGVRSIGLTHNLSTWAAAGVFESDSGCGLTRFGSELVREMNRLGILIDISHLSECGFWDVLQLSSHPIIASHSNCRALCEHPRNLRDRQILRIAENGGVIGVTFVESFINVDKKNQTLDGLIDHIDHIVQLVGIEHVGIGSDFDGGGELLTNATEYPKITDKLLDRGYSENEVEKILGKNLLRVFKKVVG